MNISCDKTKYLVLHRGSRAFRKDGSLTFLLRRLAASEAGNAFLFFYYISSFFMIFAVIASFFEVIGEPMLAVRNVLPL